MNVKAALRKHRISQQELAKALGVTQPAVSHWVTGFYEPSPKSVRRIQAAIARILRERIQMQTAQLSKIMEEEK